MAKIIFKKGMEGQNKLSCIEGQGREAADERAYKRLHHRAD